MKKIISTVLATLVVLGTLTAAPLDMTKKKKKKSKSKKERVDKKKKSKKNKTEESDD